MNQIVPSFVLFHVPHDSTLVPGEIRSQICLGDVELAAEIVRMTDHLTLELFTSGVPSGQVVRAEVCRLVVDVERFDDASEAMNCRGMGVVYEKTSDGSKLRRAITPAERERLIDAWYRPHHERLAALTTELLDQHGKALLIDAHSFPSRPLPYEEDQRKDRPDICIGTDDFHTPKALEKAFFNAFRDGGFSVRLNAPFGGALVPMQHYRTDSRLSAVMVEVNRSLYLEESSGLRNSRFDDVCARILACTLNAIRDWSTTTG